MSNVKAGDLCVIFGSPETSVNGHVVTAVSLTMLDGMRCWVITPTLHRQWWLAPEKRLRPINPPPGTVTDEEVRDLFAPSREKEAA